jgi:ssRNA-specific RNase YbeY (16S rRNA maturation enzyme)
MQKDEAIQKINKAFCKREALFFVISFDMKYNELIDKIYVPNN